MKHVGRILFWVCIVLCVLTCWMWWRSYGNYESRSLSNGRRLDWWSINGLLMIYVTESPLSLMLWWGFSSGEPLALSIDDVDGDYIIQIRHWFLLFTLAQWPCIRLLLRWRAAKKTRGT